MNYFVLRVRGIKKDFDASTVELIGLRPVINAL